ncbi:MAG TPA: HAD-IA family hydrolase [Patescibacteria group bacterium]|nr:HAD-IA family hydrolase [Patescibacteria group bacterium]
MPADLAIRAVTFDVGGTLIQPWPSVGHVYAEVASRNGLQISPELLNRQFVEAWKGFEGFNHTKEDWGRMVDLTFQGLARTPPSLTFFEELYSRFMSPEVWRTFPDVHHALETLRSRGLKLAVISNWDERLRPLLHSLELNRYFEEIVISCEVGAAKPYVRIFSHAAEALKLSPGEILHVGDDPIADVGGAHSAGFKAVLLDRAGESGPGRTNDLRDLRHQISV